MDEGWDTGAVFIDIAKAFGRVWTTGLVYKLIKLRVPERAIDAGVVQRFNVEPYLFNIYVNDIPSPRNCQTKICLVADDPAIMSTGASDHVMTHLNDYLGQLGRWLIKWKIKNGGGEFNNSELHQIIQKEGLSHRTSMPYTPEQNRVIERENIILVEAARSMLHAKNLPEKLWAEAVNTAAYVLNRTGPPQKQGSILMKSGLKESLLLVI
ncbi:hypothetical protein AVEN_234520-1 [Araneus ventricosus]|uniref:Integrase catalytic domain-containing protein n=1 Tax=Araneus ventricosus TaxID=182803 RepID=A0A4Y2AAC8_ARAVE|nr:hypothetical protein AVEN_234520-1 [Araneus ventricosus]